MPVMPFTYDPIIITRTLLQSYVEKFIEGKFYKAKQFACYEFLRTMTDNELEDILRQYAEEHNIEVITFKKAWDECELIFEQIYKAARYQSLELSYKRKGYGLTGMGVVDNYDSTFYDCTFTQHWPTVIKIMKAKYPDKLEALEEMTNRTGKDEHNGITRQALDTFIVDGFEFVGGNKSVEYYIE